MKYVLISLRSVGHSVLWAPLHDGSHPVTFVEMSVSGFRLNSWRLEMNLMTYLLACEKDSSYSSVCLHYLAYAWHTIDTQ